MPNASRLATAVEAPRPPSSVPQPVISTATPASRSRAGRVDHVDGAHLDRPVRSGPRSASAFPRKRPPRVPGRTTNRLGNGASAPTPQSPQGTACHPRQCNPATVVCQPPPADERAIAKAGVTVIESDSVRRRRDGRILLNAYDRRPRGSPRSRSSVSRAARQHDRLHSLATRPSSPGPYTVSSRCQPDGSTSRCGSTTSRARCFSMTNKARRPLSSRAGHATPGYGWSRQSARARSSHARSAARTRSPARRAVDWNMTVRRWHAALDGARGRLTAKVNCQTGCTLRLAIDDYSTLFGGTPRVIGDSRLATTYDPGRPWRGELASALRRLQIMSDPDRPDTRVGALFSRRHR